MFQEKHSFSVETLSTFPNPVTKILEKNQTTKKQNHVGECWIWTQKMFFLSALSFVLNYEPQKKSQHQKKTKDQNFEDNVWSRLNFILFSLVLVSRAKNQKQP